MKLHKWEEYEEYEEYEEQRRYIEAGKDLDNLAAWFKKIWEAVWS